MKRLLVVLGFFLACAAMECPDDYEWSATRSDVEARAGGLGIAVPEGYMPAGFTADSGPDEGARI